MCAWLLAHPTLGPGSGTSRLRPRARPDFLCRSDFRQQKSSPAPDSIGAAAAGLALSPEGRPSGCLTTIPVRAFDPAVLTPISSRSDSAKPRTTPGAPKPIDAPGIGFHGVEGSGGYYAMSTIRRYIKTVLSFVDGPPSRVIKTGSALALCGAAIGVAL